MKSGVVKGVEVEHGKHGGASACNTVSGGPERNPNTAVSRSLVRASEPFRG